MKKDFISLLEEIDSLKGNKKELESLRNDLVNQIDPDSLETDYTDLFNDFLDEICEEVEVMHYSYLTSQVLKAVDPIAYREELLAYINDISQSEGMEYLIKNSMTYRLLSEKIEKILEGGN